MISYIPYNYTIHICILPRNGHYHACKFILHFMLLLNQNTFNFQNLSIYFYLLGLLTRLISLTAFTLVLISNFLI